MTVALRVANEWPRTRHWKQTGCGMTPTFEGWLHGLGLGQYADAFVREDIGFDTLSELNASDLEALGLSLGHRKQLLRALAERNSSGEADVEGRFVRQSGGRGQFGHCKIRLRPSSEDGLVFNNKIKFHFVPAGSFYMSTACGGVHPSVIFKINR